MSGPEQELTPVEAGEASRLADHLFRHESGKLVSVLTGIFGLDRLQLAEDVVQEALARAVRTWPFHGVPQNPAAWLTRTAKNLALDVIRRERLFQKKQEEITALVESVGGDTGDEALFDDELSDGRLRLMFACCHPQIPEESQTALALKTLCGFNPSEIASAFLTTEVAIAKRLTRARQRIQELRLPFEIPAGGEIGVRLEGVLRTIYLLFNEGYKASAGESLVREDLCREAIRLAGLLVEHPAGNQPQTHALLAVMLLNGARLSTRVDGEGNLLRLKEQDRSRWDQAMIARGMYHLDRSAAGMDLSPYHLQAGIAACHCAAKDYESTNWRQILRLYDQWVERDDSPVLALNRAVVVASLQGPAAGLAAIAGIPDKATLNDYYLLHSVMGHFKLELDDAEGAAVHFRRALELAETKSERALLAARLETCEARSRV